MTKSIWRFAQSLERRILADESSENSKKLFDLIFTRLNNKKGVFRIQETKELYLYGLETLKWFADADLDKNFFLPIFNELKLGHRDFKHLSYKPLEFEYMFSNFHSNKNDPESILKYNRLFIKDVEKIGKERILDFHQVPVYIDEYRYFFKNPDKNFDEKFAENWKNIYHIHDRYSKHHHNSKNSKASKFYSTVNIKKLQQKVFEEGIGVLRNQNGKYNQIWTYANFEKPIGKLPNLDKTSLVRLQIDRMNNKTLELHAYPVGKKSIIDDVGVKFYENKILTNIISIEGIKR